MKSLKNQFTNEKSYNLVTINHDEPTTTSRIIADVFRKQHKHVIRTIENLVTSLEGMPKIGHTPSVKFERIEIQNEQNGRYYPEYILNRDGFTLLAMGFTGAEALEWKLKYIEAFNAMEEKLRNTTLDNRLEIARLISNSTPSKVHAIKELYPEYFAVGALPGTFEYLNDVNTSYQKWVEDYNITPEWIGEFPTNEIYFNYVRYCNEVKLPSMGKKLFYRTLEADFNLIRRQKTDGYRYFLTI